MKTNRMPQMITLDTIKKDLCKNALKKGVVSKKMELPLKIFCNMLQRVFAPMLTIPHHKLEETIKDIVKDSYNLFSNDNGTMILRLEDSNLPELSKGISVDVFNTLLLEKLGVFDLEDETKNKIVEKLCILLSITMKTENPSKAI